jgi:putative endonuclease
MAGGWVYILTNRRNGILYVGVTNDLVRRVFEHRSGFVDGFTKQHGLKTLVYFERFEDIRDAIQREHNIKHWPRMEGSNDRCRESGLGRSVRYDREVRRGWPGQARP